MASPPNRLMFFDSSCGPCTFLAHVTAGFARSDFAVYALDSGEADRALRAMSSETRYDYFHIVEPGKTWTGPDAMPAWVGIVGGARARLLAEKVPPLNLLLRRVYNRFWEYRRSHGCATPGTRYS